MSKRRIFVGVIASLIAIGIGFAADADADADTPKSAEHVNATAMGQSLHNQLDGNAVSYEFALEQGGRLELTGHSEGITAAGAVAMAQSVTEAGSDMFCHVTVGDIEASLIVIDPDRELPQPCAVVGIAFDAAGQQ